jgi:hypothetical protein
METFQERVEASLGPGMGPKELEDTLHGVLDKWNAREISREPGMMMELIERNLGEDLQLASVKKDMIWTAKLFITMANNGMFDTCPQYKTFLNRLAFLLSKVYQVVEGLRKGQDILGAPFYSFDYKSDTGLNRFLSIDDVDDNSPCQTLLWYLLTLAYDNGYRRHNGCCYEPLYYNGHNTHAYRCVYSIEEFVQSVTRPEINRFQYQNLTKSAGNARSAVEHLTITKSALFPALKTDRHVFSFQNGVYHVMHPSEDGTFTEKFYPHDGPEPIPGLIACNYFDLPFNPYDDVDDWYNIPTPSLQKIMDAQGWPPEVCRWLYILIGRVFYEVGERMDGKPFRS